MALTVEQRIIISRAKADPEFNLRLLKEMFRLALKLDPKILERAVSNIEQK